MKRSLGFMTAAAALICCIGAILAGCGSSVTASENTGEIQTIDLGGYIMSPVSEIETAVTDLYYKGDRYYNNDAVYLYVTEGDEYIQSIMINKASEYSLFGISVGMSFSEADALADDAAEEQTKDDDNEKRYQTDSSTTLYICSSDGTTVSKVGLIADVEYTDYGGGSDYDYDYDYDYDPYVYEYDLNNIGFYDMMGYTDWCKLSSIHYSGGEGYVDVSTKYGKYSFVNGYCMVHTFNSSSMDYNQAYSRIFRCDIVDNDNVIMVPQDSGNYEKKNLQILERHVFDSETCVYMTINDPNSKGPWIPYDFVDWSSGRQVQNDKGETVYRFDLW